MTQDGFRSVGAILGLALGIGLMISLGLGGVGPGALFGAAGCVAGGMTGERIFVWRERK